VTSKAEIIEEIVENLRPLRCLEKDVRELVLRHVEILISTDAKYGHLPLISDVRKNSRDLIVAIDQIFQTLQDLHPFTREALFDGFAFPMGMRAPVELLRDLQLLRGGARFITSMKAPSAKLNLTKALCAQQAYGLMHELSKGSIVGTIESSFLTIAMLLFEIISGEPNASLKRACDVELRKRRVVKALSSKKRARYDLPLF
jgi:hypothetical protein